MKPPYAEVDFRDVELEKLPQRLLESLAHCSEKPLFWLARRPSKRWHLKLTDRHGLLLSSAPQYEQILWLPCGQSPEIPEDFKSQSDSLLTSYHDLFRIHDKEQRLSAGASYREALAEHIEDQELLFSQHALSRIGPLSRCLRELGYEHLGLRRGSERLPALLSSAELATPLKERFDLDFYHLLEHHLERERDALYPALVALELIPRSR